jgi:hypothetical protein
MTKSQMSIRSALRVLALTLSAIRNNSAAVFAISRCLYHIAWGVYITRASAARSTFRVGLQRGSRPALRSTDPLRWPCPASRAEGNQAHRDARKQAIPSEHTRAGGTKQPPGRSHGYRTVGGYSVSGSRRVRTSRYNTQPPSSCSIDATGSDGRSGAFDSRSPDDDTNSATTDQGRYSSARPHAGGPRRRGDRPVRGTRSADRSAERLQGSRYAGAHLRRPPWGELRASWRRSVAVFAAFAVFLIVPSHMEK